LRSGGRKATKVLQKLADEQNIFWTDFGYRFVSADGTIPRELMPDYLHLSAKGYGIWAESIEPRLASILGDTPVRADAGGAARDRGRLERYDAAGEMAGGHPGGAMADWRASTGTRSDRTLRRQSQPSPRDLADPGIRGPRDQQSVPRILRGFSLEPRNPGNGSFEAASGS